MLDQVKYEYITLDLPNIQVAWDRSRDRKDFTFKIDPSFRGFLIEAAKKFPMWRFLSGGTEGGISRTRDSVPQNIMHYYSVYRVWVYEGSEKLGEISYEHRNSANGSGHTVYVIHNLRILRKRERGDSDKTKDINKALKILAKTFGTKTIDERVKEAMRDCEVRVGDIAMRKYSQFNGGYVSFARAIEAHLMVDKWEEIKQVAMDNGVDLTMLDKLPSAYEDKQIAEEVEKCVKDKKGVVVIIHGNDYAVQSFPTANAEPITEMFSTDTLPEWIKRGVGMLKLVEPEHMVGKIGYKIKSDAFFVMKGEQ